MNMNAKISIKEQMRRNLEAKLWNENEALKLRVSELEAELKARKRVGVLNLLSRGYGQYHHDLSLFDSSQESGVFYVYDEVKP